MIQIFLILLFIGAGIAAILTATGNREKWPVTIQLEEECDMAGRSHTTYRIPKDQLLRIANRRLDRRVSGLKHFGTQVEEPAEVRVSAVNEESWSDLRSRIEAYQVGGTL